MKKIALSLIAGWGVVFSGWAVQPINPGDLVVCRMGDGSAPLTSASTAVFLDEYTINGTLVQSFALPTATVGSQYALTDSGVATSDGMLSVSGNGQYIMMTGYGITNGYASVASSAAATVPRVVARIDLNGNIDTSTTLGTAFNNNNIRSVYSTDGTNIWVAGGATPGIGYTTFGSTATPLQLGTGVTNIRTVHGFGGQLYFSDSSGSAFKLGTAGPGFPTTSGQVYTNLPGFPTSGSSYYNFALLDLNVGVAGVDTAYVADDGAGGGILKYSLVGTWVSNGLISASQPVRGLTATVDGSGHVDLYATSSSNLYAFVDSTGYNTTPSGSASVIVTAGANEQFRGVGVTTAVPEPSAWVLVGTGLAGMLLLHRRQSEIGAR